MYYQPKEGYPNDKMAMGRYLRPAIDVSNAMTYKILLPDVNHVCHSTIRPWAPVKESNPLFLVDCEKCMSQL